jgi:glycerol-3-phosphate dehydrogenase
LRCIDSGATVLAAEVPFAFDKDMARSLVDVVHRRMMLGLSEDQGRSMYDDIASLAATHCGWQPDQLAAQYSALVRFSDSFTIQSQ